MAWSFFVWVISKIGETAFGQLVLERLEKDFPRLFKNKTKEIVKIYEKRIEEKNQEIQELLEQQSRQDREHSEEEERTTKSLKRRSISVEKLLAKYHSPLMGILISYATQKEKVGNRVKDSHFIKEELARFNSKYLGGTDTLIPPRFVPAHLKTQEDLEKWFKEIYRRRDLI